MALLLVLSVVMVIVGVALPRIPQPSAYHRFADDRSFNGIPKFFDVVSNLPFAVIGFWGLWFLLGLKPHAVAEHFIDPGERWPYLIVFTALLLTAFGSAYYHLRPDNSRLVWDRLPIMIAFTATASAVIAERVSVRAGLWMLPVLLMVGTGSVLLWYRSELRGVGDLRLYAAMQVYSLLLLLVALLLPPRYTRPWDLGILVGLYVLAKTLELFDRQVFEAGRLVSGHTLKHLVAAGAAFWILRMIEKRRPLHQVG